MNLWKNELRDDGDLKAMTPDWLGAKIASSEYDVRGRCWEINVNTSDGLKTAYLNDTIVEDNNGGMRVFRDR